MVAWSKMSLRASWNCFFCVPAFMQGWVTQGDSKISYCYFWYWSRVSWLLQLNSGARGLGKHLTIQLSCLLCLPSRWVSPWVLGVTQENKDPALVWIKGKPRRISYWAEWHLESCQANGLNRLTIFAKRTPLQLLGLIPKASAIVSVVKMDCRWTRSIWNS